MRAFLSSSISDLVKYRSAAAEVVERRGWTVVRAETFGPGGPALDRCLEELEKCQVVIVILGGCYGTPVPRDKGGDGERSYTWFELSHASTMGIPVLPLIASAAAMKSLNTEWERLADMEAEESQPVLRRIELWRELGRLCRGWTVSTFNNIDDFASKLSDAFERRQLDGNGSAPGQGLARRPVLFHALQRAPHFIGRKEELARIVGWLRCSPGQERVRAVSLVAPGGTGKTAIVGHLLVHEVLPRARELFPGGVVVWSFYDLPKTEEMIRFTASYFLGHSFRTAGQALPHLSSFLASAPQPLLIVLDGLERVQHDRNSPEATFGQLEDYTFRLLVQAICDGTGGARLLATSRFPLTDLAHTADTDVHTAIELDDLPEDDAIALLARWGVGGSQEKLKAVLTAYGTHALTVAMVGSYLGKISGGDPDEALRIARDTMLQDLVEVSSSLQARRLRALMRDYSEALSSDERHVMSLIAHFTQGVTLTEVFHLWEATRPGRRTRHRELDVVPDSRPVLSVADKRQRVILSDLLAERLMKLGLVFSYRRGRSIIYTSHPFIRDHFRALLPLDSQWLQSVLRVKRSGVVATGGRDIAPSLTGKPGESTPVVSFWEDLEKALYDVLDAGKSEKAFYILFSQGGVEALLQAGEASRGARILDRILSEVPDGWSKDVRMRTMERASILMSQGGLLEARGDYTRAQVVWKHAEDALQSIGHSWFALRCRQKRVWSALLDGEFREATLLSESRRLPPALASLVRYIAGSKEVGGISSEVGGEWYGSQFVEVPEFFEGLLALLQGRLRELPHLIGTRLSNLSGGGVDGGSRGLSRARLEMLVLLATLEREPALGRAQLLDLEAQFPLEADAVLQTLGLLAMGIANTLAGDFELAQAQVKAAVSLHEAGKGRLLYTSSLSQAARLALLHGNIAEAAKLAFRLHLVAVDASRPNPHARGRAEAILSLPVVRSMCTEPLPPGLKHARGASPMGQDLPMVYL